MRHHSPSPKSSDLVLFLLTKHATVKQSQRCGRAGGSWTCRRRVVTKLLYVTMKPITCWLERAAR